LDRFDYASPLRVVFINLEDDIDTRRFPMQKIYPFFPLLVLCIIPCSVSAAFKLPDTGQTKCYQAVEPNSEIPCADTGQDGAYSINPMSYNDDGNGTVTDNNTGLMWQKCCVGQNNDDSCSGSAAGYNWYWASGTYDASYNPSSESVCGALTLANHSDWRLPSKKELRSIVEYGVPYLRPTIRSSYFPNTAASANWSSTMVANYPDYAWYVYFYNGVVHYLYKSSYYIVRCVRGGQ
jgi:hypothetical protein